MKTLFYMSKRDHLGWEIGNGSFIQFDNIKGYRSRIQGHLQMDYHEVGDGIIYVMQRSCILKAEYDWHDHLENEMYEKAEVLEDGEIVEILIIDVNDENEYKPISKKQYKFKMLGNYSDCGLFEEIA